MSDVEKQLRCRPAKHQERFAEHTPEERKRRQAFRPATLRCAAPSRAAPALRWRAHFADGRRVRVVIPRVVHAMPHIAQNRDPPPRQACPTTRSPPHYCSSNQSLRWKQMR